MVELTQAGFPILADADHQVASQFGVYNLFNDNLAAPAVFIIDQTGQVVWSQVSQKPEERPAVNEILAHLP